jgi:hypothetical protein
MRGLVSSDHDTRDERLLLIEPDGMMAQAQGGAKSGKMQAAFQEI